MSNYLLCGFFLFLFFFWVQITQNNEVKTEEFWEHVPGHTSTNLKSLETLLFDAKIIQSSMVAHYLHAYFYTLHSLVSWVMD